MTAQSKAADKLRIDPSLARGLGYYTGTIMEINVKDLPGSLAGGGRYDNLIGMFLGTDVPACGVSLGLERILVVMQERGMFPPEVEQGSIDVVVAALEESAQGAAMETAAELRRSTSFASISIRTSRRKWTRCSSTSITAKQDSLRFWVGTSSRQVRSP